MRRRTKRSLIQYHFFRLLESKDKAVVASMAVDDDNAAASSKTPDQEVANATAIQTDKYQKALMSKLHNLCMGKLGAISWLMYLVHNNQILKAFRIV